MRTVQQGDQVQVHYVKRFQDGCVVSSRSRGDVPLELTIGTEHPRLPGLGLGLVGLAVGNHVTLTVPAKQPNRPSDPSRLCRLARARFSELKTLPVGKWVRILDRQGRRRPVRIMEVQESVVVVDTHPPRTRRGFELDVELIAIHATCTNGNAKKP